MNSKLRWGLRVLALLIVAVVCAFYGLSAMAKRPANLGVVDGQLAPCPDSPNCVSTQTDDPEKRMEPIPYSVELEEAQSAVQAAILSLPRTTIVTETPGYLHAEVTSWIFRFVDDVEFFFDEEAKLIHFRSASRVGHSDMGVNRKRMQQLRETFASQIDG